MSRFARGLLVCAVVLGPALVRAQAPGPGAPMPLAVDLAKVPVGSQAEYAASVGQFPPMNIHLALVSRTGPVSTLEMSAEGGMMAMAGGKMIVDSLVESDHGKSEPTVKKVLMQVGSNEPMEMPSELARGNQFKKPDAKNLVGEETVKVKAGSFKAKHYRDKSPSGDKVDYWVSESAPPLGLVKMHAETTNAAAAAGGGAAGMGPVTMELVALTKNAKPMITKPAKPFDAGTFQRQLMGGGGGAQPALPPAPAPGPASSPDKKK